MNALTLPDIAAQNAHHEQSLDWVGMADIALPLLLAEQRIDARADAGVSLDDPSARGIHMSRLYLALQALAGDKLSPQLLRGVLEQFLETHARLSNSAYLNLRGAALLSRPALVSALSGWKSYPFEIRACLDAAGFHLQLQVEVAYSSTCPCSAALARQLIQQRFIDDFANQALSHQDVLAWLGSTQGIVATPHSQRSTATLQVRLQPQAGELPLIELIDCAEQALGTAVQTAVKRADEQAFALANGQNLMFCEDAARRLHGALQNLPELGGFNLRVVHGESLHAHDAVAASSWNWGRA